MKKPAAIDFIRSYRYAKSPLCGPFEMFYIKYKSGRSATYGCDELPETVKQFIAGATFIPMGVDPVWGYEALYQA